MHDQGTQYDCGVGNIQLAPSNDTCVLQADVSGHIIKNKETIHTPVTNNHKEACDLSADVTGPLIVGLISPTPVELVTQQNLNPTVNTETPGMLKMYMRSKGCRKQKAHTSANVCQMDESTKINTLKQIKVDITKNNWSSKEAELPPNEALMSSACQVQIVEEPPSTSANSSQYLQEAEHQWMMAGQMGVLWDTDHKSIIDKIWAMENKDRKEAEKLGNKSCGQ